MADPEPLCDGRKDTVGRGLGRRWEQERASPQTGIGESGNGWTLKDRVWIFGRQGHRMGLRGAGNGL